MPIQTDLSVSPYFDDFDPKKNYEKILFKPSVAIQAREMNQLQTIIQNQIERFGDNIYTKGTIVDGCNFVYNDKYDYVKILDLQLDGEPVVLENYVGLYAISASGNLVSQVLAAQTGFQSQAPDLSTLYIHYKDAGDTYTQLTYNENDILTLYDANNSIFGVTVPVGGTGSGFANSDYVVFMPAMVVDNVTSVVAGDKIIDTAPGSTANAIILEVNTTAIANTTFLKVRPEYSKLTNPALNSSSWTFNIGDSVTIKDSTETITRVTTTVTDIYGSGATATPVTDGSGKVKDVLMSTQGDGYIVAPYTSVKTKNTSATVATLNLTAKNYLTKVTVANNSISGDSNAVGLGYSFSVSEGIVYQQGYFLRVEPQTILVEKYSNSPDEVSVGFNTEEAIINSNIDQTLLDNATGSFNYQAPGADRLKLSPTLVVVATEDAVGNSNFFPITAFSLGKPYLQNQKTSYSIIDDNISQRTYETAGNFVLDPFLMTTKTAANTEDEFTYFKAVVDPGQAYIKGKRVKTFENYALTVDQGTDTANTYIGISLNYGNYIVVDDVGGIFDFQLGATLSLRDTAKNYLSSYSVAAPSAPGNEIGQARARSLVLVSGIPGTATAQYNLYVYDITMNAGKNFADVKSVFYNGTTKGVADVVLDAGIATVKFANTSRMVFDTKINTVASTNNTSYVYRTTKDVATVPTTGIITITVSDPEVFPYANSSTLTGTQLNDVDLMLTANAQAITNVAGSFVLNSGNNIVTGTSLTSKFNTGDYIKISPSGTGAVRRIDLIANNTTMYLDTNVSESNAGANVVVFYPQYVHLSLANKVVNVNSTAKTLTINFANATGLTATSSAKVGLNIKTVEDTVSVNSEKTSVRDTTVAIKIANNVAGASGPWALGKPDIFRLKAVYRDTATNSINATSVGVNWATCYDINDSTQIPTSATNVTNEFYIDHNQNLDYYDYGYLYLKPLSSLVLNSGDALICQFDHFTTTGYAGYTLTRASYNVDDTLSYDDLMTSSSVNTFEIPEFQDVNNSHADLINYVDFRPRVVSTAANTGANAVASTINPPVNSYANKFNITGDAKFPYPATTYNASVVYYQGRADRVVVDSTGTIKAIKGRPATGTITVPIEPDDCMTINVLYIPPYPSIPIQKSSNYVKILNKRIGNEKYSFQREKDHAISVPKLSNSQSQKYQPRQYSMAAIGALEDRIAALEYYVAFSLLESSVKDRAIASSVDPAINRFKYGFLADNFTTTNFTDVNNPEYSTTFLNNEVVARQTATNFEFEFNTSDVTTNQNITGKLLTLPYSEYAIVSQSVATVTATTTTNTTTTTTTTSTTSTPAWQGTLTATPSSFTLITSQTQTTSDTYYQTIWTTTNWVGGYYYFDQDGNIHGTGSGTDGNNY